MVQKNSVDIIKFSNTAIIPKVLTMIINNIFLIIEPWFFSTNLEIIAHKIIVITNIIIPLFFYTL